MSCWNGLRANALDPALTMPETQSPMERFRSKAGVSLATIVVVVLLASLGLYYYFRVLEKRAQLMERDLRILAVKANQVSGGGISIWGLRITVALGVAVGVALGTFRIVSGTPLHWYIIAGYVVLILQTWRAVRVAGSIVPLAYDSGGVTTSTVTVPLVTALGLGLASTIPGRSPVIDGFGLIAFASLFPMISVLGYAELSVWKVKRRKGKAPDNNGSER